tara:strand:+ start:885 stop:1625 length:741 start_codon:yes stop_codon:yes gene_type:complete
MKYFFLLFTVFTIYSQNENFEKKIFIFESDTLKYRILKPLDYDSNKKYPVHLFLHGAGERGNDNQKQLVHGSKLFLNLENRKKYKSWVIFPQCPIDDWWGNKKRYPEFKGNAIGLVIKLMESMLNSKNVDDNRIYVSGLSMGGMGTFEILSQKPNMFAAATPICGSGELNNVEKYAKKVPIWIFHGALDKVVLPSKSLQIAEKIIEEGGNPRVTIYESVYHDSWNNTFEEKDFLSWIHSKSKNNYE